MSLKSRAGSSTSSTRMFVAALLALAGLALVGRASAAPHNILLIIADDYGADSSSLYNSTQTGASLPPTPNIASLAQSGVLFRNAYANPICSPTRACLITGRHGFRTGIGDVVTGPESTVLTSRELTLPEVFAANAPLGYQLAQFGKWHLANGPMSPNTIGGWPYFAGMLMGGVASYTNWTKTVNGVSTANYTNYATTDLVNEATAWIQTQTNKPWFAWVAFNAPHNPLHKPPNTLCPHYTSLSGTTADINANARRYFEAMTEAMDTELGRLLAAVNRTNTHIIFLGDNGTLGQVIQPPFSAARAKDTLYEGGVRVPFIVAGPAVANPGRTNDTLVHAVDVFATILDLAGISNAATLTTNVIDSQSIVPALTGTSNLTRYVYAEKFNTNAPAASDGRALRNSQFKLIQFTGREELYDLLTDPYENTNLLSLAMTATQQANYHSLVMRLGLYQDALTAPTISTFTHSNNVFTLTVLRTANTSYRLWRATTPVDLAWAPVTNASVVTNGGSVRLADSNATSATLFYRVEAKSP